MGDEVKLVMEVTAGERVFHKAWPAPSNAAQITRVLGAMLGGLYDFTSQDRLCIRIGTMTFPQEACPHLQRYTINGQVAARAWLARWQQRLTQYIEDSLGAQRTEAT